MTAVNPAVKPAFDPNQAFQPAGPAPTDPAAKPTFDPSQSFSPVSGDQSFAQRHPTLMSNLDTTARVLDYPGGFMREGVFQPIGGIQEAITGQAPNNGKGIITKEDLDNIEKGRGPNSAEYLKRLGVSEGGSIHIPLLGNVTLRDAEGFALDVATDPLTALAKAVKEMPAVARAFGLGANDLTSAAGKEIYKSGLAKVDAKLAEKGVAPISDVLLEHGAPVGSAEQLANKVEKLSGTFAVARDGMYQEASSLGANIVTQDAKFAQAEKVLERMKRSRDPEMLARAKAAEETLTSIRSGAPVDLATASEWKTDFWKKGDPFSRALSNDLGKTIVETGNKAKPGLGTAIDKLNDRWGPVIAAQNPLDKAAAQAASKPLISPITAVAVASGHGPLAAAWEGAKALNTTPVKTAIGKTMMNFANPDVVNLTAGDFARRTLGDVIRGPEGVNSLQKPGGP